MTDYERIGGEEPLRALITDFIQRVYNDMIIGFFFMRIDQATLIQREFEFASAHLGGPHTYQGRPLAKAHGPHRINNGHFHRRIWLLETVLHAHNIPEDITQRWLKHDRQLLPAITDGTSCQPTPPKKPFLS